MGAVSGTPSEALQHLLLCQFDTILCTIPQVHICCPLPGHQECTWAYEKQQGDSCHIQAQTSVYEHPVLGSSFKTATANPKVTQHSSMCWVSISMQGRCVCRCTLLLSTKQPLLRMLTVVQFQPLVLCANGSALLLCSSARPYLTSCVWGCTAWSCACAQALSPAASTRTAFQGCCLNMSPFM